MRSFFRLKNPGLFVLLMIGVTLSGCEDFKKRQKEQKDDFDKIIMEGVKEQRQAEQQQNEEMRGYMLENKRQQNEINRQMRDLADQQRDLNRQMKNLNRQW